MQSVDFTDTAPKTDRDLPGPDASPPQNLPAVLPAPVQKPRRRRWVAPVLALAVAGAALAGGGYWWQLSRTAWPSGIVWSNGRIEADEIDIATKFAGRISEVLVDEGDLVAAGQVVARMDTRDLEASLGESKAEIARAEKTLELASAEVDQQRSQMRLAEQQLQRARILAQKDYTTRETFDQRQAQLDSATGGYDASLARVGQAEQALEASRHAAALIRINIADNTLKAPRDGRIQYRLANVGEVLSAGGKVFTMLDTAYVYMDVFLPTAEAGRAAAGSEARILLDAYPDFPIPAKVVFVADQAQFTPKAVETKSERDKLMFRVRVRIDPDLLRGHAREVRSGLPGVAYIRIDPVVEWPSSLQPKSGG